MSLVVIGWVHTIKPLLACSVPKVCNKNNSDVKIKVNDKMLTDLPFYFTLQESNNYEKSLA